MKKYVMFVNNTSQIGGAQLYILRKAVFLINNSYDVYIITGRKEPIEYKEFESIQLLEIEEILFPPNLFTKKQHLNILDKIIEFVNHTKKDEIYVESHQTSPAIWAELFAEKINSTNIVYAIAALSLKRTVYNKFFKDKLIKNELLGCNRTFIETFFNTKTNNNYINIPFDKNEIVRNECDEANSEETYDLALLTISRIDKTYIKNSIINLGKYTRINNKVKIKYNIYLSKTSGNNYKKLLKVIKKYSADNFNINLNGPISPLNTSIFRNQDLFIGMGTSILNASAMRIPSLVVDFRNNKYYGFFGVDHFEFGLSSYLAQKDLSYFVDYLLKNKNEINNLGEKAYTLFNNEFESGKVNNKFLKYLEEHTGKYEIKEDITLRLYDKRDLLDFSLIFLFGVKKALQIRGLMVDTLNKFKNHI